MAESATLGSPVQTAPDVVAQWRFGEILRDIARGGLAGLVVGVVVGGPGARIAMRLIAVLIPSVAGSSTENGNRIGDITLGGSVGLIMFVGLFVGIVVGTIWVVVSPWLPRRLGLRVLAAIPLAISLGSFALVQGSNPDFIVLRYDPRVVVVLLGLVGLVGASMAVVDAWLDRRLPRPPSVNAEAGAVYSIISVIGALVAIGVVAMFLEEKLRPVGIALVLSGIATLAWWYLRYRGAERPPLILRVLGSGSVIAAVAFGFALLVPHVRLALGIF